MSKWHKYTLLILADSSVYCAELDNNKEFAMLLLSRDFTTEERESIRIKIAYEQDINDVWNYDDIEAIYIEKAEELGILLPFNAIKELM